MKIENRIFKNRFLFISLLVMAVCSFYATSAMADNNHLSQTVDVSKVPYEHIADYVSQDNETKDSFLLRIAPFLRKYSEKTGYEACGIIAKDNTHYSVVLGSSHSHIACLNDPSNVLDGMTSTNETIHSHGKHGLRIHTSEADVIFLGNPFNPPKYIGGFDLNHFSDTDFDHPGFLATTTGVIYQSGKGKVAVIN